MQQQCCKQMHDLVIIVQTTSDNPSRDSYASTWIGVCTLNKPKFFLWWKTKVCFNRAWKCSRKSQGGGGTFNISHHTTIIATTDKNNNNIINIHNVLKMIVDCKELMLKLFIHREGFAIGSFLETFKQLGMRMFISSWKPC